MWFGVQVQGKLSLPDVPIILIVKDNIYQHQHDHCLVPKNWVAVLKNLEMETKSLIVRDWHELNHGAENKTWYYNHRYYLTFKIFHLKATPHPVRT